MLFGSSRFFHIFFAAYFYRGEFAELLFCHAVNIVDMSLQVVTMDDRFEADMQRNIMNLVDKRCQWFTSV